LEALGDASQGLRDIPESIRNYHAALELLDPLASDGGIDAVRLQRKIVQLATEAKWNIDLGSYNQVRLTASASRTLLRERLPAMQHEPHAEVVNALATLSFEAWRSQDPPNWEEAESYARAAVAMAEQLGSAPVLSRALGALGNVLDGRSLLREHLEIAMRRLTLSAAASPEHSSEAIDATREAGMALMYVGEYEKALPHLREAEQRAHEARLIGVTVAAIGLQAQCAFRLDRFDEVLALEEKWRDLERHYPRQRVGPTCFYGALSGSVHALRGDGEQARAHARESVAYMELTSGNPEVWQRNQFY
jgi:tetratricopeptide (TPR) repeat protein